MKKELLLVSAALQCKQLTGRETTTAGDCEVGPPQNFSAARWPVKGTRIVGDDELQLLRAKATISS